MRLIDAGMLKNKILQQHRLGSGIEASIINKILRDILIIVDAQPTHNPWRRIDDTEEAVVKVSEVRNIVIQADKNTMGQSALLYTILQALDKKEWGAKG